MNDRVAVIGATGYLGRMVVAALLKAGLQVTMVARRTPADLPVGACFVAGNASIRPSLAYALRGSTKIVNVMSGPPASIVQVALHLRAHVADARAAGTPIGLVHVSSLAVFGQASGTLDEATPPAPARGHRYGTAKSEAEKILLTDVRVRECCAILRPGCLYGPRAPIWSDRIGRLLLEGRLGTLGSEGRGWCSPVHVRDMARAVVTALAALAAGHDASGIHHILSPVELTWNEYFCRFGSQLGLASVPAIGRGRLAVESWILAPVGRVRASLGRPDLDILTPTMRRVFRGRGLPVCHRPPLLPPDAYRPIDEGLAEAASALLQSDTTRLPRQCAAASSPAMAL